LPYLLLITVCITKLYNNGDCLLMIKELLNNSYRAGLANIDLQDLKELPSDAPAAEFTFHDDIAWHILPDRLRIECTREFSFNPECNFRLRITYFVEHFLKEENSLSNVSKEDVAKEISEDLDYYLQTSQGLAARLSMLAAQITSTFGGTPAITPPFFPIKRA